MYGEATTRGPNERLERIIEALNQRPNVGFLFE